MGNAKMIRTAVIDDINSINVLHEQLHIQHIGYRPDIFAKVEQPIFDKLMIPYVSDDDKRIFVSENGGMIDGYAAVSVHDTVKRAGEIQPFVFIEVEELCVADSARGNGIGSSLLDAVKKFGSEKGARFVELSVHAENEAAQEFYKANGMFVKTLKMQYKLQ